MVMTYSRAKVQGQQSVVSKDNSQKKWTDRWTEASAVTFVANTVRKNAK